MQVDLRHRNEPAAPNRNSCPATANVRTLEQRKGEWIVNG